MHMTTTRTGRKTEPLPIHWQQSYGTTTLDVAPSPALLAEIRRMARSVTERLPVFGGSEVDTVPAEYWTEMRALQLRPRAVSVLVALRNGERTRRQLRSLICDASLDDALSLLRNMCDSGLVLSIGDAWRLTVRGIAWLQVNDLDATDEAKRAVYPEVQ